ncbi:hypothetical protein EBR78_09075 [bacterium]|nr:hypothetical protein [bacterium]
MLASVQLRQVTSKLAKAATVNSQIMEEHRSIATLVGSIPKIEANALLKDDTNSPCSPHPRQSASFDVVTGQVSCNNDNPGALIDDAVWEGLTTAFWNFVGSSEFGSTTENLSVARFDEQVLPELNNAGCVGCHAGANFFFDRTQKWGLGSVMGRRLLSPAISFPGTLADQNLQHFINFQARSYNLATGEINSEPNEQCRALVDSNTVRTLGGCTNNCPLGQLVPGSLSCPCVRQCCDRSGKNCSCCQWISRFRCREPQVSQSAATCTSPLVVRGYQAYRNVTAPLANSCGGAGVKTYWRCENNGPPPIPNLSKWSISYEITTRWINENDKLPRNLLKCSLLQGLGLQCWCGSIA